METEPDLYLPNLSEYIVFEKGEQKNIIDMRTCTEILNKLQDRVKKVDVYYNPYTTELVGTMEKAKFINIFTRKEV